MKQVLQVFAAALIAACAAGARADTVATLSSPDGALSVAVTIDGDGRPGYAVTRGGKPVIDESRLGFILAEGPKLERGFRLDGTERRSADTTWEQPWGERRFVRDRHEELRVHFVEKRAGGRRLDVVFRAFDDGVGFRYEFPAQAALTDVGIVEELTEFAVAEPATAWWIPAGEWNRYEYLYRKTPLAEVGQAHTPMTVRTASGLHLAFHEAALVDYAAMWLRRGGDSAPAAGQRLKAVLAPAADGPPVRRTAPFATPWRTILIAPDAAGLYESNIELNLNAPNALGDVSWFKPFKYVGIWWSLHLEQETWATGPRHGATTENAKRYVDFAARNGFRGVLIEGWNRGWDGDWFADGGEFDFTTPTPDFDLEAVAAYAKQRGVHLVGHHETAGNVERYESQLGPALDLYARLGIDSVKTGYVADAGGIRALEDGKIRYEWHDGQFMSRHHLRVVTEAAKRHLAVNPHEPIKDTGLRRTYPNWVAREGARGMEYNAWGHPPNPPEHEANLVFTRMLAGPMDFTPGVLSLTGRGGQKIPSTIAKQLALYVVIYSPIQMAADLPENYAKYPGPFRFIRDVPADWAETKVVAGDVGDFAAIARKDRNSEDWYLGAVTDENARTLEVPLDFLDAGKTYRAEIYRDADDADWDTNPHAIVIEKREARKGEAWSLRLAPGGGFAIRFKSSG
jgi:alpha-glucosidase